MEQIAKPDFKARMTVRLAVAGAFHTDFMEAAVDKVRDHTKLLPCRWAGRWYRAVSEALRDVWLATDDFRGCWSSRCSLSRFSAAVPLSHHFVAGGLGNMATVAVLRWFWLSATSLWSGVGGGADMV